MWFLALGARGENWFVPFLQKLLQADRRTLRLLRRDPFDGAAPKYVRARIFHYRYSTWTEKRQTGLWWIRRPAGVLVQPLTLADGTRRRYWLSDWN